MSEVAISVNGLIKEYEVYTRPIDLALEILTRRTRHKTFRALDGVSFDVNRGEVLGIIGSNGAGKSTLLKIITGVLDATGGSVNIIGRVTAILELGLGFNPEYSGRENIYLSGLLYGMNKAEIDRKLTSIIQFSGLNNFIDRPVKTYSSGMQSRLAFSIATAVDPDILIIDEALAAGDSAFVQKCLRRIRELCSGGRTVLLVSHGTGLLAQLCQRVVWLEAGQVKMIGPAIQVVQAYDLAAHQAADTATWLETVDDSLAVESGYGTKSKEHSDKVEPEVNNGRALFGLATDVGRQVFRRGPVLIDSVEMINSSGFVSNRLTLLEPFSLKIHYHVEGDIPKETLGVAIAVNNKLDLSPVGQFMTQNIRPFETRESYHSAADREPAAQSGTLIVSFDYTPFRKGEYLLSLGLIPNEPATWEFYEYRHLFYLFSVDDAGMDLGAPVWLNPTVRNLSQNAIRSEEDSYKSNPQTSCVDGSNEVHPLTLRQEITAICYGEGAYPDGWPRHSCCPACGTGALTFAFSKYGFSHSRCGTCGFVCVDPYPPESIINKLYNGRYYTEVRELFELPMLQSHQQEIPFSAPKELLLKAIVTACGTKQSGSWLDVGGGIGSFANFIRGQRPGWDVHLSEKNGRSIEIAEKYLGLSVVKENLQTLKAHGQRFDVVSTVAVLEHIPDPYNFLSECLELVLPGGCLINIVPHFSRLNAAVSQGASSNVVPPFHTSLFNEAALRALLERLKGGQDLRIEQFGTASFKLIDHVPFGDYWDVSIPTKESPIPRSIQLKDYEQLEGQALSVLADADLKIGDYFAETDGKMLLASYLWKN